MGCTLCGLTKIATRFNLMPTDRRTDHVWTLLHTTYSSMTSHAKRWKLEVLFGTTKLDYLYIIFFQMIKLLFSDDRILICFILEAFDRVVSHYNVCSTGYCKCMWLWLWSHGWLTCSSLSHLGEHMLQKGVKGRNSLTKMAGWPWRRVYVALPDEGQTGWIYSMQWCSTLDFIYPKMRNYLWVPLLWFYSYHFPRYFPNGFVVCLADEMKPKSMNRQTPLFSLHFTAHFFFEFVEILVNWKKI